MRRKVPRIERTLIARCRRCSAEAHEAVGHRYAASVYHALSLRTREEERARELFRQVFELLGESLYVLGRWDDLTEHVRQVTEKVCAGAVPGARGEPIIIAPANGAGGEAEGPRPDLGEEAAAILRRAADQRRPELAARQRRRATHLVIAVGALVVVLGVLGMAAYARGYRFDPRTRARRVRLELVHEEIASAGLLASVREVAEELAPVPGVEAASVTADALAARQLEELSLTLEEIVNADAKTVWSELPYLQERVEAFDLVALANDLAEERTGQDREALARTALVLEQIVNL